MPGIFCIFKFHNQFIRPTTGMKALRSLRLFLWFMAIHSFIVGLLLLVLNGEMIGFFGFAGGEAFFRIQGGVFHLVMCVAYCLAALRPYGGRPLIILIIAAKFMAFAYLLIYYFVADPILVLLLSGIGDGLMGLAVLLLLVRIPGRYFTNDGYA